VTSFSVGGAEGYMTASTYPGEKPGEPGDGPGEVFLKLGKQGSTLAGVMDAFSMAISISLQYGVPLQTWVEKFTNMRFEPAGMTDDPDIRIASSVMDYIFRRLALDHLPYEERAELGIFTAAERSAQLNGEDLGDQPVPDPTELAQSAPVVHQEAERLTRGTQPPQASSSTELVEEQQGRTADAPLCLTCGTKMRPAGSCYVCEGCGSTSGNQRAKHTKSS
jgi:ribonucleoside-diphosphate reductase alpha chain